MPQPRSRGIPVRCLWHLHLGQPADKDYVLLLRLPNVDPLALQRPIQSVSVQPAHLPLPSMLSGANYSIKRRQPLPFSVSHPSTSAVRYQPSPTAICSQPNQPASPNQRSLPSIQHLVPNFQFQTAQLQLQNFLIIYGRFHVRLLTFQLRH